MSETVYVISMNYRGPKPYRYHTDSECRALLEANHEPRSRDRDELETDPDWKLCKFCSGSYKPIGGDKAAYRAARDWEGGDAEAD